MSKIVYRVNMAKIPDNCQQCVCHWCSLPLRCNSRGGVTDTIKKAYTAKRHPECPLIRLEED